MNLEIHSYVGVGLITFGMTRDEVRSVLPGPYEDFQRGKPKDASKLPDHFFKELGIFVYYAPDGKCKAIEMTSWARPTYAGHQLLGVPPGPVIKLICDLDPKFATDSAGLTAFTLGIGLYIPGQKHNDLDIEGVIAFQRGYYDNTPSIMKPSGHA